MLISGPGRAVRAGASDPATLVLATDTTRGDQVTFAVGDPPLGSPCECAQSIPTYFISGLLPDGIGHRRVSPARRPFCMTFHECFYAGINAPCPRPASTGRQEESGRR